jgi:hypothetical protein
VKDQGVDGTGMDLRVIGWGSVDWIQLAQDMDRWRALMNTVMNLRVLAPRSWLKGIQITKYITFTFLSTACFELTRPSSGIKKLRCEWPVT